MSRGVPDDDCGCDWAPDSPRGLAVTGALFSGGPRWSGRPRLPSHAFMSVCAQIS